MKTTVRMRALRACKPGLHEATVYSPDDGQFQTVPITLPDDMFNRIFVEDRLSADIYVEVSQDDEGKPTFAFAGLAEEESNDS